MQGYKAPLQDGGHALAEDDDAAVADGVDARGRGRGRRRSGRRRGRRTFLSRMARRTTAPRPMSHAGHEHRALDVRAAAPTVHVVGDHRADARGRRRRSSRAPTIDSWAPPPSTNFAGGSGGWLRQDRPLPVVEVEDRVDRDQVHVGVVVGVQGPDVAPVAAVAVGRRRARRCRRSRRRGASPCLVSIGMMLPPMSCTEPSSPASARSASISASVREDVVAHRGEDLVGVVGQAGRVRRLLEELRDVLAVRRRLDHAELRRLRLRHPDAGHGHPGPGLDVLPRPSATGPSGRRGRRRRRPCSRAARRRPG